MAVNPLNDIVPPGYRKVAYAVLTLLALALAAYKVSEGDWVEFVAVLLGSLGFGTAASNTNGE